MKPYRNISVSEKHGIHAPVDWEFNRPDFVSGTGMPKDSVANVSQIVALDKEQLTERSGKLSNRQMEAILSGIDVVPGR